MFLFFDISLWGVFLSTGSSTLVIAIVLFLLLFTLLLLLQILLILSCFVFLFLFTYKVGPGWLSRYSNALRARRSVDRIPLEARFSAPVQIGPGAHRASCTMGTASF
jgi:hypothetical protein